ncbi:hypothetical protein DEO45_02200 [Rhodanobacter denitrificans]|uniref:Sulfotransferase family protein n=1 Tax=Rhodanobacter denitrificans TaxID=666685 RepID=A0A368KK53_9GAMM|nr:hypothetical protein [Rhodanobacter denitrificans]RCS31506.1 hypothetical protein DEO45_02200 [Rhodanobacter denitrificans]
MTTSRAIIVLGMHRSGTSAITRVLNLLGVELGGRLMPAASNNNESGFWEHTGVVEVHDTLLHALDRSWHDLRPLPNGWLRSDAAQVAKARLLALIESDFSGTPLWAVKDPRLCRLLPLWRELLLEVGIEPCALMVLRHPDEVARSLRDRDGFPLEQGRLLWLEHVADAERDSSGWHRCVVAYDDLLSDWRSVMGRVGAGLAVDWPHHPDRVAAAVDTFLDRGQRHHAVGVAQAEELPVLIQDVYGAMRAVARGEDSGGGLAAALDRYRSMAGIFVSGFGAEIESNHIRTVGLVAAMKSDAHERSEAMLLTLREIDTRVGASVSTVETQPNGDSATLYWCDDGAFDEAHKVTVERAEPIGGERLVFRLPSLPRVSRLRIDPSVHPGRFDLLGLRLNQIPVEDFAERVERVNQLRLPSQGPGHVAMISMNDDPHLEVNVDDLAIDWIRGVAVEIDVVRQHLPKVGFDEIWQHVQGGIWAGYKRSIADLEQRSDAFAAGMMEQLRTGEQAARSNMLNQLEELLRCADARLIERHDVFSRDVGSLLESVDNHTADLVELRNMMKQLRAEEQTSRSDMLNKLEELLQGANALHVEQHDVSSRDVRRLLERADDHAVELAELRKALKAMDDERRGTLLQRIQRAFRRH